LSFSASASVRTITIPIIDNYLHEEDEQFQIRAEITSDSSGVIAEGNATIVDNDPLYYVSFTAPTTSENVGELKSVVWITPQPPEGVPVIVHFTTVDAPPDAPGAAEANTDYTPVSVDLTFSYANSPQTVTIPMFNNAAAGGNKTLELNATVTNLSPGNNLTKTATLQDDETWGDEYEGEGSGISLGHVVGSTTGTSYELWWLNPPDVVHEGDGLALQFRVVPPPISPDFLGVFVTTRELGAGTNYATKYYDFGDAVSDGWFYPENYPGYYSIPVLADADDTEWIEDFAIDVAGWGYQPPQDPAETIWDPVQQTASTKVVSILPELSGNATLFEYAGETLGFPVSDAQEELPGNILYTNDDDDNRNQIVDDGEGDVSDGDGDDDLLLIEFTSPDFGLSNARISADYDASSVRLWLDQDRTIPLESGAFVLAFGATHSIYVEGLSESFGTDVVFQGRASSSQPTKTLDRIKLTIGDVTGFVVDWQKPDGTWSPSADDEVVWEDDSLRWTAFVAPSVAPYVQGITWGKQSHPSSSNSFAGYSHSAGIAPATGNPGIGEWDISPQLEFTSFAKYAGVIKEKPVMGFAATVWRKGDAEQRFEGGDAPLVFPERNKPAEMVTSRLLNEVVVEVTLVGAIPEGFRGTVFLKAFDPDHELAPSNQEEALGHRRPDPNDSFQNGMKYPDDNRPYTYTGALPPTPGAHLGAHFDADQLLFEAGDVIKEARFVIDNRQPGNNFIAVARGRREWLDLVHFGEDAEALFLGTAPDREVPQGARTAILTVWRTLHVELDSLGPPTEAQSLLFGPEFDDVNPGDLGDLPIAGAATNFAAAKVRVIADLQAYDPGTTSDNIPFVHNLDITGDPAFAKAIGDAKRGVKNNADFWAAQVINGYEASLDEDYDDDTVALMGHAGLGDAIVWVFSESIRDFLASPHPGKPALASFEEVLDNTVYHELLHLFNFFHGDADGEGDKGILDSLWVTDVPGADISLRPKQIGGIQGRAKPN
jgi:hypothetical protein